jgi:hypothetical protein
MKEYEKLIYNISLPTALATDGLCWCLNNLGERWCPNEKRSNKWSCTWIGWFDKQSTYQFSFAEEKDSVMFKLKFS